MNERVNYYSDQAKVMQSDVDWLSALQKRAVNELKRSGFPTRKDEDWKYTRVDGLLAHDFKHTATPMVAPAIKYPVAQWVDVYQPESVTETGVRLAALGVIVMPLLQALHDHADKIQPLLTRERHQHAFDALNTAMLAEGLFIYLPKGVQLAQPLVLSHWQDHNGQVRYLRHLIVAEANSSAVIVEDYVGAADMNYCTNTMTELCLDDKAHITHYKVQRESTQAYHIGQINVTQGEDSHYENHLLNLGAKLARCDLLIRLQAPRAQAVMNGIYAPKEGQHHDQHTIVRHEVADCHSDQEYRGILSGKTRAVFNGSVYVAPDAQKTLAKQQNKNLLLSAHAEIDTKPQLEIYADDVVCTHGATVGQLDEEAIFYLATRGIDTEEARRYLIHAFAAENIRRMPQPELAAWLGQILDTHLE